MPLPVTKGSLRSPRVRAGSRVESCQSRSASTKSGSPASTVTVECSSRSVTIAAAYRCVTSARTRRTLLGTCATLPTMALPVTTLLVEDAAAGLASGGWRYTQRQLYYATCARAETTPSDAASNGEIGLGVLMILVGLIFIGIKVAFALFVTHGLALILAGILGRMRRPKLTGRLLALSFDEFRSRFGSLDVGGLIPPESGLAAVKAGGTPITIVTDSRDSAAMIAANADRAELAAVQLLVASDGQLPAAGTHVIVLHDASPRG